MVLNHGIRAALATVTPLLAIPFMVVSIFAILLNTLRIRWMKLEHEAMPEHVPLAKREVLIPNMVCEGCAAMIRQSLQAVPVSAR